MSVFAIVGSSDPLYETEFVQGAMRDDQGHLNQFIVHSSLDTVNEQMWKSQAMYLKQVDTFNEQLVSAFVTAGQIKFVLLHQTRNEDGIKNFFNEVHELYIKLLMNPFYSYNSKIISPVFDKRVHEFARRFLGSSH